MTSNYSAVQRRKAVQVRSAEQFCSGYGTKRVEGDVFIDQRGCFLINTLTSLAYTLTNQLLSYCHQAMTHLNNRLHVLSFSLLSPHDALKHHFTSMKTDLIFLHPMVLEGKFP